MFLTQLDHRFVAIVDTMASSAVSRDAELAQGS